MYKIATDSTGLWIPLRGPFECQEKIQQDHCLVCGHVKVARMTSPNVWRTESSVACTSPPSRLRSALMASYPPITFFNGRRRSMHPHNASFIPWTSAIPKREISAMDVKTTRSTFAVAQVTGSTTTAAPRIADSTYKSTS